MRVLFEATCTSFFKDKKSQRSHKTVGIMVFSYYFCLMIEWSESLPRTNISWFRRPYILSSVNSILPCEKLLPDTLSQLFGFLTRSYLTRILAILQHSHEHKFNCKTGSSSASFMKFTFNTFISIYDFILSPYKIASSFWSHW